MRRSRDLLAVGLAVLLVACIVGGYLTRTATSSRTTAKQVPGNGQTPMVDDRLLQTARQIASTADTNEEQALAQEALRLSDHEVDQAFATALREATASGAPASGPFKQLVGRISELKARIATEQARIAHLTEAAATREPAADELDLAKAQLALDKDDLDDAQEDLARQGGDKHAKVERALQEHEALHREAPQLPKVSMNGPAGTLSEQARQWLSLRNRERQLLDARQQAAGHASVLEGEHNTLEKRLDSAGSQPGGTAAMVARLRRLSDQRRTLTEFDKRIQDSRQLADVYLRWSALVGTRQRSVLHALLRSLAFVVAILLTVMLIDRAIRHAFGQRTDRRRLHQLRLVATIGVQLAGALLILLILFGPPTQMSTMLGLATAGLTLVLKDFIVAFFGWFVLMGRNGIRVGDWVEIKGVSGEVVEIGLLRTVLLEMGNWTDTGHPTGRRVAFVNSFAIEGHYFNFSTAGQWLWDELQVSLPAAGDPYQTAQQIRQMIEQLTATDAHLAKQDWERVTHQYGIRTFSAKPAVDLRPSGSGLNVIVRYITRAPQRYEVKSRLFHSIIDLLHKPAGGATNPVEA